jgi:hypothetical protein
MTGGFKRIKHRLCLEHVTGLSVSIFRRSMGNCPVARFWRGIGDVAWAFLWPEEK